MSPPERESRPGGETETAIESIAADEMNTTTQRRYDGLAGMARRRGAALRSSPLEPCGCVRDPGHDRHRCDRGVSDVMTAAAVAAMALLDSNGTPGLLDTETCRAMHRAGHRRLAVACWRRSSGWCSDD